MRNILKFEEIEVGDLVSPITINEDICPYLMGKVVVKNRKIIYIERACNGIPWKWFEDQELQYSLVKICELEVILWLDDE